jgi:glycosyltransferase involved in cell wall biosynthesis
VVSERLIRVAMIGQKGFPPVHGGVEKHVAELASRLSNLGFQIEIYSRPHYSAHHGSTDLPAVHVRKLPSIPTKHLDAISHSILATADVIPRRVDIVHYHALGPGLLAGWPRWLVRKKSVITVHGLDWQREKWGAFARAVLRVGEYGSVRLPHATIVVSEALRDYYLEQHGRHTYYIPNGIVPPVYREPELIIDKGITGSFLLFVGRLVPEKGCHLLLEAYSRLPEEVRRQYALVIAGGAGFTQDYVHRLRAASVANVHFLGYVHGPILDELYTNATLVVLPSTLEGLSITLLEGMSYGRCCVASDIPPNREAAAGLVPLFPSGDAAALAQKILALLGSPEQRHRVGQESQLHVIENYSWDAVANQTASLYRELVGGTKPSAAGAGPGG